jgi:hypothetical protein
MQLTEADLPHFDLGGERFVRPDFAGRGLANVAPTVLRFLAPRAADSLTLPPLDADLLPRSSARDIRTVILLVADGLGYLQLLSEVKSGNAPTFGELIARASANDADVSCNPITSVFPTTTVAALGSVNSGVAPASHGLLGYTLYLPEFGTVAEMIRWGPLNRRVSFADPEFGQAPERFIWAETIYSRLHAAGVERTFAVNPSGFSGTALTRMLHQHATYAGYIATSSLEPIVARLSRESTDRTYIYGYWPTVDTIAHLVGPLTPEHGAEVAALDLQLGRLLRSLDGRGDTLVLVTADHGHLDTVPDEAIQLTDHPELLAMLRVYPAGERRVVYLHPRPGASLEVAEYARERLGDVGSVMLREDAVDVGLFGPGQLSERAAGRIGEVLLFPRANLSMVAPIENMDSNTPKAPVFRGLHGGLTTDEAVVPLLAVRT